MINFISTVYAAETVNIDSELGGFFKITCLGDFISKIISLSISVAGIILLIMLVWGGISYMTSGGDKNKLELAQTKLTQAIIGLAIVAASWALWTAVLIFFGIGGNICGNDPTLGGPPFTGVVIPPQGGGLQP